MGDLLTKDHLERTTLKKPDNFGLFAFVHLVTCRKGFIRVWDFDSKDVFVMFRLEGAKTSGDVAEKGVRQEVWVNIRVDVYKVEWL